MHNSDVQQILEDCKVDVDNVKSIIDSLGISSSITPYLSKYSVIKTCGAIEIAYKSIVADYCCHRSKQQVKNYIDYYIRESSSNPSYHNIVKILSSFDKRWATDFVDLVKEHPRSDQLQTSLQSLVDARNDFAHGGDPTVSIDDVIIYFQDSYEIMTLLDSIIH